MPGLPDIIGHCRHSGRAVYCEVKTKGDRLSEDQRNFLASAAQAGAIVYLSTVDEADIPQLIQWKDATS